MVQGQQKKRFFVFFESNTETGKEYIPVRDVYAVNLMVLL